MTRTPTPDAGAELPGAELDIQKMPGHWLLARMGKRVLRPGGLGMTRTLLDGLAIRSDDEVVELAPGLGTTAREILTAEPKRYSGVERDPKATAWSSRQLASAANVTMVTGSAEDTGLPDACASVVIGEAMLTMNTHEHKQRIVREAFRVLRPGGRYGIHELSMVPDQMPPDEHERISRELSSVIHVGARPLRESQWKALLEDVGFTVESVGYAPMHLLRPKRLVEDEGFLGALRVAKNVLTNGAARRRVFSMRRTFERHRDSLSAIYLVAKKPD